jgi:flagellar hook-associated protein 1 FlgK
MGDMLSSGVSGLLAFQRALDTTSHNVANANTLGYSRQSTTIGTRAPQAYSNGFIGSGAEVQTVRRSYDNFVAAETRNTSSTLQRLEVFSSKADNLNNLFGDSQTGLTATLQRFINALQDVANSPSSVPARQVVLSQAQSFGDRLAAYDARMSSLDASINSQMADEATAITALARNIAELNQKITIDQARTGQPPNDLLDQRDRLLDDLATHVNIQVVSQDDGSLIVSIGAGQPLVVGNDSATLSAGIDSYDPTRATITLQGTGTSVDITSRLSGGTLGGLQDFRRDLLEPTRNALGRLTVGLTEVVNAQHREGIDLNGALGQDIFSVGGIESFTRNSNAGTGAVTVTRQQPSAGGLTDHDYIAEFNGASWTLRYADTGVAVAMSGAGTLASPFLADGMSIVVSGAPAATDSFLIRPTRGAINGLNVLIEDPAEIAAAAPIATSSSNNNVGNGNISAGEVLNAANPALQTPVSLVFNTATTYQINGVGAAIAYTPGANIDINGWRVAISGSPLAGDSFAVGPNTHPAGDNRNALKLSEVLAQPVLNGGAVALNAAAGQMVGRIGVATNQAHTNRDAQQAIHTDNLRVQDSIAGVNLDEEAANLMRYQQAYQAAAQVISTAATLFQTVLDATRR